MAQAGAEDQPFSLGTAFGGGICLTSGSLQVSYSTISGNSAVGGAGHSGGNIFGGVAWNGGEASGGGVFIQDATASITSSNIDDNTATGGQGGTGVPYYEWWGGPGHGSGYFSNGGSGGIAQGGGIACVGSSSLLLQSNSLSRNKACGGDGGPVTMAGIPPGAYYLEYGDRVAMDPVVACLRARAPRPSSTIPSRMTHRAADSANPEPRIFPTILPMSRVDMMETEPAVRSAAIPLSWRTTISLEMLP